MSDGEAVLHLAALLGGSGFIIWHWKAILGFIGATGFLGFGLMVALVLGWYPVTFFLVGFTHYRARRMLGLPMPGQGQVAEPAKPYVAARKLLWSWVITICVLAVPMSLVAAFVAPPWFSYVFMALIAMSPVLVIHRLREDDETLANSVPGSASDEVVSGEESNGGRRSFEWDGSSFDLGEINPATGLPMVSGSTGVDVGGNAYGCCDCDLGEINPATGLPMVSGSTGVDVGGNAYGCGDSDWDTSTSMGWDSSSSMDVGIHD